MFHAAIDIGQAVPLTRQRSRPAYWAALAIAAAAITLRFGQFGNPLAGLDEQFYLLVGERMWAGELPYVDIWDRKPIGLFLLFAAIARLPFDHVLAAQIVATVFAGATAFLIALIARRAVGWRAATLAGVFYLAGLNELWGETTQTPVFYNALVAAAAWLTLHAGEAIAARRRTAYLAIALCGAAIQIKTSAVFEGAFFGLWLLGAEWRARRDAGSVATLTIRLATLGIAPTLAAFASFAALGHAAEWWQCNVTSILQKGAPRDGVAVHSFWETMILFAPATLLAVFGLRAMTARFTRFAPFTLFMTGWCAFAAIDFAAIGGFYPHYAIPLLLAVSPLAARVFAIRRWGLVFAGLALAWPFVHATLLTPDINRREQGYAAQVAAAIPREVRTRCLYVFEGPVAYYRLSGACRNTRYPFSAHLSSLREGPSLGVDPATELHRIVAGRPAAVLTVARSSWPDRDPAMMRLLLRDLRANYYVAARLPHRDYSRKEVLLLWRPR